MVVYLQDRRIGSCAPLSHGDIEAAIIEGADASAAPEAHDRRLRVGEPRPEPERNRHRFGRHEAIATPIVGGMITSTIHVLILVPVFFAMMKGRAVRCDAETEPPSNRTGDETLALAEQPQ
jgi:copper/silver efflux system protein